MEITLRERTENNVKTYFVKANMPEVRRYLPQKATTLEEAIADFKQTLLPGAKSYGETIYADNVYVGDIWCYCIDPIDTPNAMVSYCIFEQDYWGNGIATEAMRQFVLKLPTKYPIRSLGAFTYSDNIASIYVLEKNGFLLMETFTEDGIESKYYELQL